MCYKIKQKRNRGRYWGFSFIEVMVVVVIIGLLAAAVGLKVGTYINQARLNRAKSDIATIKNAVEAYHLTYGLYPSNEQGLGILPLENLKDPWKREYQYNFPGRNGAYEIICYGADGREGGEDDNADITNDTLDD